MAAGDDGISRLSTGALYDAVELDRMRSRVHAELFEDPEPVCIARYRVLERVGVGGMGVVYAAYDNQLDRKLAIKVLRAGRRGSEAYARLLREAQALGKLSHPNVVQVHDAGEWEGRVFIAMEFLRGRSLDVWLEQEQPSVDAIVDRFAQAGAGLAAAHAAGLIHRDFKPANVFVADDGRVRVVDFGVARGGEDIAAAAAEHDGVVALANQALTQTGKCVGTPAYMAPEQFAGLRLDERSDQFAFAVSLYEALHGERPFAGSDLGKLFAAIQAGRRRPPPPDRRVARRILRVIDRALQPKPEQRFASMGELLAELRRKRAPRRSLLAFGAIAAVATAGVGTVGIRAWTAREAQHSQQAAALAAERVAESERARAAEIQLQLRRDAVTLAEADQLIDTDPTRAVALLNNLSDYGWTTRATEIAAQAAAFGVAERVVELEDGHTGYAATGWGLALKSEWSGAVRVFSIQDMSAHPIGAFRTSLSATGDRVVTCCERRDAPNLLTIYRQGVRRPEQRVGLEALAQPAEDSEDVSLLVHDPSGQFVVAYRNPDVAVYGHADGRVRSTRVAPHLVEAVLAPGGDAVFARTDAGDVVVVNMQRQTTSRLPQGQLGNGGGQLSLSPEGRYLAAVDGQQRLLVWRLGETPRLVAREHGHLSSPTFSPDGQSLAVARAEREFTRIELRDASTGRLVRKFQASLPRGAARALTFSEDGAHLLVEGDPGWVAVLALDKGASWSPSARTGFDAAALSADGRTLMTLDERRFLRRWTVPPPRNLHHAHDGPVVGLAQLPSAVVSAGSDGVLKLWMNGLAEHKVIDRWSSPITQISGSYSGYVAATDGETIRVYDQHGMELRRVTPDHGASSIAVALDTPRLFWTEPSSDPQHRKLDIERPARLHLLDLASGARKRWDIPPPFSRKHVDRCSVHNFASCHPEDPELVEVGGHWPPALGVQGRTFVAYKASVGRVLYRNLGFEEFLGGQDTILRPEPSSMRFEAWPRSGVSVSSSSGIDDRWTAFYASDDGSVRRYDSDGQEGRDTWLGAIQHARVTALLLDTSGRVVVGDAAGRLWVMPEPGITTDRGELAQWAAAATDLRVEPFEDR